MGVFSRFMDIINANINSALDRAEDPEKMLRLMITQMEDALVDLKSTTASHMAQEIRLKKRIDEEKELVERWENRARMAIERGKEDLAREALVEKRNAERLADDLKSQLEKLSGDVREERAYVSELEGKIESAKERLKGLVERRKTAERERDLNKTRGMKEHFERMEESVNRMESQNDLNKTREAKFEEMERDEEIERELERMKKEAGK